MFDKVTPDLTIYDEAHHIKATFNKGYEIFLTATPSKYYYEFGDIIEKYDLRSAINDGYLTNYYINIFGDEGYSPDPVDCIAHIQQNNKKTIVYCNTNLSAKDLYYLWLDRGGKEENTYYISCNTGKYERELIYKSYKSKDKAIIFNCAILGEGIDFTDCDSVFIYSGYTSINRIVQAVGRPLRLHENKTHANIYMINDKHTSTRINAIATYDPLAHSLVKYIY